MRVWLPDRPGALGLVASRIGAIGGDIVGIDVGTRVRTGSPLCLGSDSNSVIDVLEEARALELDQRRATGRRVIHAPEELLEAATVAGMRALGWDAGELKAGMLADFATVQPPRMDWRGLGVGYLIFCCSARDVTHVVVGGRTVVGKAS